MRIALLYEVRPDRLPEGSPDDLYAEFESLETIQAIVLGLEGLGHTVDLVDSQDRPLEKLQCLRGSLDLVLNTSVGIGSRFREVIPASICEALGLPYTGSDPMALALAANKHVSKLIARSTGVATPPWFVIAQERDVTEIGPIDHDILLKPVFEGSSIGVTGPLRPSENFGLYRDIALELLSKYAQPIMVEHFVNGYEVTIPLLGNPPRSLPPLGLFLEGAFNLERRIFDSSTKTGAPDGIWRHDPPIPAYAIARMQDCANKMHCALGCRDFSRSDFRVTANFEPFFTEINPVPQFSPIGNSFTASGAALGWDFRGILEAFVTAASERCQMR
jgi:D-alanine-D-alanine ligase